MIFTVSLETQLVDRLGRPLGPARKLEGHSWLRQWAQILNCHMGQLNVAGVLDTASASQTIVTPAAAAAGVGPRANAALADDAFGIQVGTGSVALDRDDNILATKIVEGAAAGQLNYQVMVFSAVLNITGGHRISLSRQFNNNSGGTITVNELGLVVEQELVAGTGFFLILRDLVAGEAILDGNNQIFRYHLDFLV